MLTQRQSDLLRFIVRYADEHGMSPTYAEMADGLSLTFKSSIFKLLDGLQERGFIRRIPYRARAVEVLKRPEATEPPIDRAKRNLVIAQRALEEAGGKPFGATLALIAIRTAMEHLGEAK